MFLMEGIHDSFCRRFKIVFLNEENEILTVALTAVATSLMSSFPFLEQEFPYSSYISSNLVTKVIGL